MEIKLKAVQLDLARQFENLEYIKSFIDFIARYDYNCLVMYLEGRVRTKSFPRISESESYSSVEITEIVAYAAARRIEVIPVVSLLGHADLFLKDPQYALLAELRGGRMGRFSDHPHVFCPSLDETCDFFECYLTELAELFPSKYFHAGFDEAWDIGYCDLCRERLKNETQADIFSKHLQKCYDIVVGKLNKKMIIWDDMFDIYPSVLNDLPKDIIMCAWHYDMLVEKPAGHCGGPQSDKFKLYDKLGFEYWFAPATFSLRNVMTFTDYAVTGKPSGVLLTSWCMERDFLFSDYPSIAYGGKIWSQGLKGSGNTQQLDETIREVTGCCKAEQVSVIKNIISSQNITLLSNYQAYLRGPLSNEEYERKLFNETAMNIMLPYFQALDKTTTSYPVVEDIVIRLELEAVYFELRELLPGWFDAKNNGATQKEADSLIQKLSELKKKRRQQWNKYRCNIEPCATDSYFNSLIEMIHEAIKDSNNVKANLNVKFQISCSKVKFLVKYQGLPEWEKIASGGHKVRAHFMSQQCDYPIYSDRIPEKIRIESSGYTGTGIVYIQYSTPEKTYVPAEITSVAGNIYSPDSILENGRDFCFLGDGEQAAREKFCNPELSKKINSLEINLK